jgi:hypothetical protein
MNLKTSFVLFFHHVPYRLSTKGNPWFRAAWGVDRCSLGLVFNTNTCRPRLVFTRQHIATTLLFGYRCWPMPRHDYRRLFRTQNYDGTSRIPWALHSQTHFFYHENQTPLGKIHVECGGVLTSRNQTHTIPRFDSWAPTWTTNTKGNTASSFRVPYQIRGLWQYLKVIMVWKAHKWSFP